MASAQVLGASGYIGLLIAGALIFLLPWLAAPQLSLRVAPAWGWAISRLPSAWQTP